MNNNISFKANFISPEIVKQICPHNGIREKNAAFIELASGCAKDKRVLRDLNSSWGERKTFVSGMIQDMDRDILMDYNDKRYFALTLQRQQLNNPLADEILGAAEIVRENKNLIRLKYLQAHPDYEYFSFLRAYSGIGTAIINSLKKLFPSDDIILRTRESTRKFYEKNGFVETGNGNEMILKRSKAKDLPK